MITATPIGFYGGTKLATVGAVTYSLNSALLNGSTHYFSVADSASLSPTTGISYGCWIQFNATQNAVSRFMNKWPNATGQRSFGMVFVASTNKIVCDVSANGSAGIGALFSAALTRGQWYHSIQTYDGTTSKLYIDGVEVDSVAVSGGVKDGTATLYVGNNPTYTSNSHTGDIAFPKVYNRGLSAAEVTELYNSGTPKCWGDLSAGLQSGCVFSPDLSNWTGHTGNELVDNSGNSNDLTNLNSTPFTGAGLNVSCT